MSDENVRLRGALQRIVDDGDFTAPENMKRIAREALSNSPVETSARQPPKSIATVINNNQPGWTNIVETAPNVTLPVGTKLYDESALISVGCGVADEIWKRQSSVEPTADGYGCTGCRSTPCICDQLAVKAAERTVDGYTCRKCGVWYAGPNGFHDCSPENASAELCEGCPPVGYPTDTTRCTPCPRRSEKLSQPRVPQNEYEATLTAIRTRDTESVPTWFKEPPLGACGRAFIDRRWLLKELDTLRGDMAQDQQRIFHLESALAKPTP